MSQRDASLVPLPPVPAGSVAAAVAATCAAKPRGSAERRVEETNKQRRAKAIAIAEPMLRQVLGTKPIRVISGARRL